MWGFLKEWNTEIGLFSRRNSEKLHICWRISEMEILADAEFFYFDRYLTGYFAIIETEIGNHPSWEPP